MNTIFIGNGLNRISYGNSWQELVHAIGKDGNCFIPNTVQFNAKAIKQRGYKIRSMNTLKEIEKDLKTHIINEMRKYKPIDMHHSLIDLHPDHIITTNYDRVINISIQETDKYTKMRSSDNYQEQKYSLRRCCQYMLSPKNLTVWNIHGEIDYINSIMLGYDHYCDTIGKIDDYINGKYKYNKRLMQSMSIYNKIETEKLKVLSWIDLFFFSDIHIIGFGMDYSELDLWYVLMKRKMIQVELGMDKVNNRIFYYEKLKDKDKQELLNLYDVQVIDIDTEPDGTNYYPVYHDYIDIIEQNMNK